MMPVETELKFRMPARDMGALAKGRFLRIRKGRFERAGLLSTYFDTAKHKLKRHGLTLRIRKADGKNLQTVKSDVYGPIGRGEWEAEIGGPTPNLRHTSDSPLRKFDAKKLQRKLKPVFKTQVERTTVPLRSGPVEIELAIDKGRITAGRRSSGIAEVELELKRGSPSDLFRFARTFEHRTRAELYLASKSERGYALTQGEGSPVCFAEPITLQHDMQAIDAFRIIVRSTIRHFADNADAVRAKDPEGVHQMRVGLRRTRAVISIFTEMLPSARTERIKLELKWLTNELAPARELDVFTRKKVGPATRDSVNTRGARAIKREFAARRHQAFTRARVAVTSSRYRRLLIDVVEWLETATQGRVQAARKPIAAFAGNLLHQRLKKIRKIGKCFDTLSAREQHKLRIKIKKLRYALEFFESLYAARRERRRLARLSQCLKSLQDALGSLNDFVAHRKITAEAALRAPRAHRRARAFVAGVILGKEEEATKPLLNKATKAVKRISPFPSA